MPGLSSLSGLQRQRYAMPAAFLLGYLESSFVLIALEPIMIPLMARFGPWRVLAFVAPGNVLGALTIYALGAYAAEPLIEPLIAYLGAEDQHQRAVDYLRDNGLWGMVLAGLTPIPFQLECLAAGAIGINVFVFLAAVTIARVLRYGVLGGLVALGGERLRRFAERHERWLFAAGLGVLVVTAVMMFIY